MDAGKLSLDPRLDTKNKTRHARFSPRGLLEALVLKLAEPGGDRRRFFALQFSLSPPPLFFPTPHPAAQFARGGVQCFLSRRHRFSSCHAIAICNDVDFPCSSFSFCCSGSARWWGKLLLSS